MDKCETDPAVDNSPHLAKLAQYTASKTKTVVNINIYPKSEREAIAVNPYPDPEQEARLKRVQEGKSKKRSIEPEIADMETEIVDAAKVLVPTGDDSDSEWTQAN